MAELSAGLFAFGIYYIVVSCIAYLHFNHHTDDFSVNARSHPRTVPAMLCTSFDFHGEPIANAPASSLSDSAMSGIDMLCTEKL